MRKDRRLQELESALKLLESEYQAYREKSEALRETKKRFYSLSNRTQDGIYNFSLSINKYVYTNPSFIKMFGHPCKDIVTTDSVMGKILPPDRSKLKQRIEDSLSGRKDSDEIEYRCVGQDGGIRWMHDRWVVLRDDSGVPTAIEGIVRDITDMKDITSLKDYLESILESCMDAIVVTNEKGTITLVNEAAESLLHKKRDALMGSFIADVIRNEPNSNLSMYDLILKHAPTSNYEFQAQLPDGTVIPLLISSAFLRDSNNCIIGTINYIRDISVIKQTEERIRMLSQRILRAQEVERSSIARDLHDHLAQNLYSFNIQFGAFLQQLQLPEDDCGGQQEVLSASIRDIIADVRKMVFNIHPTSLETLGLNQTILNLCDNISQIYGLKISFQTAGMDVLDLNFDVKITIYRLIQEGLNNIVRHASASSVKIRLVYSYPNIILRIEDNGVGFDVKNLMETTSQKGCMGLWSMKERIALLCGRMKIKSDRGVGTHIFIEIPYDE